jgi:predicted ATPase with chaperone activity
MVARRLTTILPAMTLAEALETTRIHSVAGLTGARTALVTTRPLRAPHHTISAVGLIGGGHIPMPGEVSLAHHGVLFLDELPEFRRHVLEVLRQPLEEDITRIQFRGHYRSGSAGHTTPYTSCRSRLAPQFSLPRLPNGPILVTRHMAIF